MESTRNKGGTFSHGNHGMNEICRGNLRMWVLFSGKRFTINITFLKKKKIKTTIAIFSQLRPQINLPDFTNYT